MITYRDIKRDWEPALEDQRFHVREGDSMTFSEYFFFGGSIDDLARELGVELIHEHLKLPRADISEAAVRIEDLRQRLERTELVVNLESEAARREFQIAPILYEAAVLSNARVFPEYSLTVSSHLQGSLDFLLQSKTRVAVVEAKRADRLRGAKQLLAEVLAVARSEPSERPILGTVTFGEVWQFAMMAPDGKRCELDGKLYHLPDDVRDIIAILVAALRSE